MMATGSLLQAVAMLTVALLGLRVAETSAMVGAALWFVVLILYHAAFSRRVVVCTPGETIAGCVIMDGRKQWMSRFTRSRWLLFVTLFLVLLYPANAFDPMMEGANWPLSRVLGRFFAVLLYVLAVVMMAWGRLGWAFLMIALFIPGTLRTVAEANRTVDPELRLGLQIFAGLNVVTMGLLALCVLVYWRRRLPRPTVDSPDGSVDEQRGPVAIADPPEAT